MFEALKQIRPPAAWQALSWSSAPPTSPKTYRDPLAPGPLSEPGGGLGSPGSGGKIDRVELRRAAAGGELPPQLDRNAFGVDSVDELRRTEGGLSSTPGDEGRGECEQHKPFRSSHGEEADTLNPG
jgi:hypothetical protein